MKPDLSNGSQANRQTLANFAQNLTSIDDLNQLYQSIVIFASEQFASETSIHLLTTQFPAKLQDSEDASAKTNFHRIVETSESISLNYITQTQEYLVGLPLTAQKESLGSLILFRKGKDFDQAEISLLEGFGSLISMAVQSIQLGQQQNNQQKQLSLIASVTSQLAHISNLEDLTREVCRLILETFGYYYVAVFTVDPDSQALLFRASARSAGSTKPAFEFPAGIKLTLGEHIVGYVAQTGRTLLANDVSQEVRYGHLESLPETEAELAIPLKIGKSVVGVLDVQSDQREVFTRSDVVVLSTLADSIAFAISKVRLYNQLEQRNEQMDLVANVTKSITSILDLDNLINKVVERIHREFNYPYVHIFLLDRVQNKIEFKTGSGKRAKKYREQSVTFDLNADRGIIPLTVRTNQIQLINDVKQDPLYIQSPVARSVTGSELTIPLGFTNEVFGVLDIQSNAVNAFTAADIDLLSTLAASISIAIRNAKLYNSEKWRRRVAESLQDVASLLVENIPLDETFQAILKNIQEILPCDLAAIWLLDENGQSSQNPNNPSMTLTATRSNSPDFPVLDPVQISCDQAWFCEALAQGTPFIRKDSQLNDPFYAQYHFDENYSAIAAPLSTAGKKLGVLTLHHHTSNRYGPESQNISASFAGYTAIAIDNARLFQESKDQAWISTILLQVAKATQSLTSIDELTSLIGQLITLLIGGKKGGVFLFDHEQNAFYIQSIFGDEFSALGLSLPLKIGQPDQFTQVADSRQTIAMPAANFDPALVELLGLLPEDTILLLPLIAHNEILGVLMHVSSDLYQQDTPEKVLGKQKFAILQGIAQQIAVSIQNINLLDTRQEETYISSVLLQVSQTIVSTPNLTESLGKIYYILHMLAGVEGCATFQLVPATGSYELMHALSDQLHPWQVEKYIGTCFTTEELPFLQESTEGKPYIVKSAAYLETINRLTTATLSEEERVDAPVLNPTNSVYIIFQLSVRGENYGLLVCRDPDIPKRERRLELLNGVAQQISFAIQNDRLEQARNQQERVEQEFRLARQIQKTFLPENLPKISGYDLDVHWQTARQVGGDFYDAFEIKPGLFGFTIADVSDKGLAAALYMTVTRTLIRAIALESFSPARTLERVNQLLQLDSKRGFFVTCFYGILDQERHMLLYSNAGHLPPYHLDKLAGTAVKLERGGIALGAMEEITLAEHAIELAPGDGLVLFTDGVTEAFNKVGSFYGEARYQKLLQKSGNLSASGILETVEQDLEKFRRDAPLSDDITQMVLKRLNSLAN
ncbi:MAG: GAF domain-containing protein [Anaerolineaceae bacterium]